MPVFSTNCHQAPDRAVVTGREESESERECETTPFVFSNSQFIQHIQICVSTWHDQLAFVHTFYYNVTGISNLSPTRRPPTLFSREARHENSTRLREREAGSDWEYHTLQSLAYISYSYGPSAQGRPLRPNAECHPLKRQWSCHAATSVETNRSCGPGTNSDSQHGKESRWGSTVSRLAALARQ